MYSFGRVAHVLDWRPGDALRDARPNETCQFSNRATCWCMENTGTRIVGHLAISMFGQSYMKACERIWPDSDLVLWLAFWCFANPWPRTDWYDYPSRYAAASIGAFAGLTSPLSFGYVSMVFNLVKAAVLLTLFFLECKEIVEETVTCLCCFPIPGSPEGFTWHCLTILMVGRDPRWGCICMDTRSSTRFTQYHAVNPMPERFCPLLPLVPFSQIVYLAAESLRGHPLDQWMLCNPGNSLGNREIWFICLAQMAGQAEVCLLPCSLQRVALRELWNKLT